jgi:hypothetical protein
LTALHALALISFIAVPGWLAASLLREEEGSLDSHEKVFTAAMLGVGVVSAAALLLSLVSAYSLPALLALVGGVCVVLALRVRKKAAWPVRLGFKAWLLPLAMIVVALILSAPPGRTVFGWSDVGIYANIAAHIENEGGIEMEVPTVREVEPEHRGLLYKPSDDPSKGFLAYENKAFFITDFEAGSVTPRYYFLWPSFMAAFASFLGLQNMFWAVTAAGVLALWGLFLLARRLLGWRWGLAAAALGGLSPLFVYFSRYCTSEMMNLALFVAASLCLTAYLAQEKNGKTNGVRGLAATAAFLFALGFLCRIDFILVIAPLGLFFLGKKVLSGFTAADGWFCGLTLAGGALASVVGAVFSKPYFNAVLLGSNIESEAMLVLVGAVLFLAVLVFVFADRLRKIALRIAGARRFWTIVLWLSLAAIFIYLYGIRPGSADRLVNYGVINPMLGPSYVNQTLVRWAWYFSTSGLVLIFIGYGLWFSRRRSCPEVPVALIGAILTLFYGINMRCTPLHLFTMRRLVPIVFPAAMIVIAYVLKTLIEVLGEALGAWKHGAWAGQAVAAAILLYLVLFSANASIPIFGLEEGGNQLELSGEIADTVGEDAVVLMDFQLGDLTGPSLRCFYGIENGWIMDNTSMGLEEFAALLADLEFPERPVYLLWRPEISGAPAPGGEEIELERAVDLLSSEEMLEKTLDARPSKRIFNREEIWLFELNPIQLSRTGQ